MRFLNLIIALLIALPSSGQYHGYLSPVISNGVHANDKAITGWATIYRVERGYLQAGTNHLRVSAGDESSCTGKADNITVSLGDGGVAVVGFNYPLSNGEGYDFAVFENSFDGLFLELAHVDVSTDSISWVRFPSKSLTPFETQTGAFGQINKNNITNLAGKYQAYYGTPFDLGELSGEGSVDINNIRYIRITDVIGSITPGIGSTDSEGNMINDPWPTPFESGGFDLDAVAVLKNYIPGEERDERRGVLLFPNPATEQFTTTQLKISPVNIVITDRTGRIVKAGILSNSIPFYVGDLHPGIYFISGGTNEMTINEKIIITGR